MTAWLALLAIGGAYVAVLLHRRRAQRLDAWRQLQRERGRLRP